MKLKSIDAPNFERFIFSIIKTKYITFTGIVTITVLSTVGVLFASVVLFKVIKKARHLQTLETDDEKVSFH